MYLVFNSILGDRRLAEELEVCLALDAVTSLFLSLCFLLIS